MKFSAVKTADGNLIPAGKIDADLVDQLINGVVYQVDATLPRNYKYHRRFMAMLRVAFDAWTPPLLEGEYAKYGQPDKDFEHFRKDVLIVCGYRKPVWSTKSGGQLRFDAVSISFATMDDVAFKEVYSKVSTYLLGTFLTTYTADDLDRVVNELVGFI